MQYIKFFLMTAIFIACNSKDFPSDYNKLLSGHLSSMNGSFMTHQASNHKFPILLALTPAEQTRGLSTLKPEDFPDTIGMLFVNSYSAPRVFWMPDTYFDLDIIFLDENMKIVFIDKNVPHHPGRSEDPPIYRTPSIEAVSILEVKAGGELSKLFKVGDVFDWNREVIPPQKLSEFLRSR